MKGSIKIAEIAGIDINIHITFFLLIFIAGKWFLFVLAVFFLVTLHELAHSLVAKSFGINVREITLLPIGGVAGLTRMPDKPYQEFLISIAGPLTNIAILVLFYYPVKAFVGDEIFFQAMRSFFTAEIDVITKKRILAEIYWINLVLAGFNLIPAFPMDGGRILRSILAQWMGLEKATKIAVIFGHAFSIIFGYIGLVQGRFILVIIAVFIYMSASSEEFQVGIRTVLSKFKVKDVVKREFLTLQSDAVLSNVLELIYNSAQEDFPVMDGKNELMIGFVTRSDIINGVHQYGASEKVSTIMRRDVPKVDENASLDTAQSLMQANDLKALPVIKKDKVIGIVSIEDISRVYGMMARG